MGAGRFQSGHPRASGCTGQHVQHTPGLGTSREPGDPQAAVAWKAVSPVGYTKTHTIWERLPLGCAELSLGWRCCGQGRGWWPRQAWAELPLGVTWGHGGPGEGQPHAEWGWPSSGLAPGAKPRWGSPQNLLPEQPRRRSLACGHVSGFPCAAGGPGGFNPGWCAHSLWRQQLRMERSLPPIHWAAESCPQLGPVVWEHVARGGTRLWH